MRACCSTPLRAGAASPRPGTSPDRRDRGSLATARELAGRLLLALLVVAPRGCSSSVRAVELRAGRSRTGPATAQAELQAFRDALTSGDEAAAAKHLVAGETALAEAREASEDDAVRLAAGLPWIGRTVDDLDHLLGAADILTAAARDGMDVYTGVSGVGLGALRRQPLQHPRHPQGAGQRRRHQGGHGGGEAELRQVHGDGPKGGDVLAKKESALRQIDGLRTEITALEPMLEALPAAVGADGPRTYLVAIMNPAEMRASGGAPLSVAFLRLDDGKLTIPVKGATSELTNLNELRYWDRLAGSKDPFQPAAGLPQRFVNLTFNPSFDVSGRQLVRGTEANFGIRTDGVIALDLVAIGHLLDATGPLESPTYGTLTSANLAQKLLVDGYAGASDPNATEARHDSNEELMTAMLSRLTEGGGLIGKATALGEAIPSRHLQMWFRDPRLQHVVQDEGHGRHGAGPADRQPDRRLHAERQRQQDGHLPAADREGGRPAPAGRIRPGPAHGPAHERQPAVPGRAARSRDRLRDPLRDEPGHQPDAARGEARRASPSRAAQDRVQTGSTRKAGSTRRPPWRSPRGRGSLTWEYVVPRAARVEDGAMTFVDHVAPQNLLRPARAATDRLAAEGLDGHAGPTAGSRPRRGDDGPHGPAACCS